MSIEINGENISEHEAESALRMFCQDCKKIAGEFHNMNRSPKFRVNWPDEDKFASSEWRTFVEACRTMYSTQLGDPHVSEHNKKLMHRAIVLWDMLAKQSAMATGRTNNIMQIMPGTMAFDGDKTEHRNIIDKFGMTPNLRAWLKNTTAKPFH